MSEVTLKLQTTSARLLAMAVALVGSSEKVQAHMGFTKAEVVGLLAGDRELTWPELDKLTTLLVREQESMIFQNRDLVELIRLRATNRRS